MTIQYSSILRNELIAPGAADFTQADIPDMSGYAAESPYWVSNFFLNSAFRARFKAPMHAYTFNFLRRTKYSFSEHHLARKSTLAFVGGDSQSVNQYVDALFHWESFLSQAWHAYAVLIKAWDGKAFDSKDGSIEQRLNALYNQMKHVESRIYNGQMIQGATIPVWLENQGLRSVDEHMSFDETAEVLKDLANYADALMDPKTAREKLDEAGL